MDQKIVDSFPLTLALSPRGKRVKWENQLRGRGDNRKKSHTIISDRVKYNRRRLFGGFESRHVHYQGNS